MVVQNLAAAAFEQAGIEMAVALNRRIDHDAHVLLGIIDVWCALCVQAREHRRAPVGECQTCQTEGLTPKFGLKGSRKPRINH